MRGLPYPTLRIAVAVAVIVYTAAYVLAKLDGS